MNQLKRDLDKLTDKGKKKVLVEVKVIPDAIILTFNSNLEIVLFNNFSYGAHIVLNLDDKNEITNKEG